MATPIPDDELGRYWVQANIEDSVRRKFSSGIFVFLGFGPQRQPKIAGTGFAIGSNGRDALVITAKHVLTGGPDSIADIQNPHRRSATSMPDVFRLEERPSVDIKKLRAVWVGESQVDMCVVHDIQYTDHLDIAICTVSIQEHTQGKKLINTFALDTSLPKLGSKIAFMSSSALDLNEISIDKSLERQTLKISKTIIVRMGVITNVFPTGHRQFKFPCFETSIPVEPGMSGGLFYYPLVDQPIAACGVASTDFSDASAKTNFLVSGQSLAAMIWPVVGFSMPGSLPASDTTPRRTVLDCISAGEIPDVAETALTIENLANGDYRVHRLP